MDHSPIALFLGSDPEVSDDTGGVTHISYTHSGALLKYEILISPSLKQVAISADPVLPFSGQSIFEFYINADSVRTIENTYQRKNPVCLGFWIGNGEDWNDCRMTLHMRDDGDLIVWPRAFCFDPPQNQAAEHGEGGKASPATSLTFGRKLPIMKIAILSLLFCSSLQAQSDLPSTYDALTENYERAVERVTKPLTSKYIEELKKIQRELSEKGDQKGALEVENKLKELGAIPWDLAEILKSNSWEYTANTSTSLVVFRNDGTVEVTGEEVEVWEWTVKDGNILQLHYPSGGTCDFNFADFKTFSITGKTDQGKRRFLEPNQSAQP